MADEFARSLRKRMTDAERRLWFRLRPMRREGLHFRRQSPIGRYIADFECRRARLIVEVDGLQHHHPVHAERDRGRDQWLEFRGYAILRYDNGVVLQHTDQVVSEIIQTARWRMEEFAIFNSAED